MSLPRRIGSNAGSRPRAARCFLVATESTQRSAPEDAALTGSLCASSTEGVCRRGSLPRCKRSPSMARPFGLILQWTPVLGGIHGIENPFVEVNRRDQPRGLSRASQSFQGKVRACLSETAFCLASCANGPEMTRRPLSQVHVLRGTRASCTSRRSTSAEHECLSRPALR